MATTATIEHSPVALHWSNWSGSVSARPRAVLRPRDEQALGEVIKSAGSVRPTGAGHSFMPLCQSDELIVSLEDMDGDLRVAADRCSVRAPAGWSLKRLTAALWREGLALANQGDVNPQSLAGSMATGTHGTGRELGSLATLALGFRLIMADGAPMWCDARTSPDLFQAQRLSLGMFGIATEIEVAVVPAFYLIERTQKKSWDEVRESFDDLAARHRHVEFWFFPHADDVILKTLDPTDPCDPPPPATGQEEQAFRRMLEAGEAAPGTVPSLQRRMMAARIRGRRRGPAHTVFPSERTLRFEEMEYEMPLAASLETLDALVRWVRDKSLPVSFPFEYRVVAADDIWMSPMNQGLVAAISMHQYAPMPWRALFAEAEAVFRGNGGRPHWAKRHNLARRRRYALSDGGALPGGTAVGRSVRQVPQRTPRRALLLMNDHELHAHLIGRQGSRGSLNTPALVLDIDALDRNIAGMASIAAAHGFALRPHAKTHKSVDIARRQIAAGAVGLCCAKIGEAEVLADGGIPGLLITSPVAAPAAFARLATLAERSPGLMAVVDHPNVVAATDRALAAAGTTLDVIIDIDPGIRRTGVASAEAAIALAAAIQAAPRLRYRGVQYYCGAQQNIEGFADRRAAIEERTRYLQDVIAALADAGFAPEIVTGSGTGSHRSDLALGVFTELQAGSYVFMDQQYLDCDLADGAAAPFAIALEVDARVVSANHAALVTIDAGYKSLSTDGGTAIVRRGAPSDARFMFMGDEHGALIGDGIGRALVPGDAVTLAVPHCDPTVNLYDTYHVVRGDTLIDLWPIDVRGRAR